MGGVCQPAYAVDCTGQPEARRRRIGGYDSTTIINNLDLPPLRLRYDRQSW